ncbi:MAG: hypothetical protein J6P03_03885 [Opitutales bacterium]|nr:hypothetical protein [Opitutales bacterium]
MPFNVGEISFINYLPFCAGGGYPAACDVVRDYPARLNNLCRKGMLDVSPISFYAFKDISKDYEILSNFTIACFGAVDSVKLYANCEIEGLKSARIFFTEKSESSIAAFSAVCKYKHGFDPRENACFNPAEADAAFLIGDDVFAYKSAYKKAFDIGALWSETFGSPMVFSVIAAKKSLPRGVKNDFISHYENSLKIFFADIDKFSKIAAERFSGADGGLAPERAKSYFLRLSYRSEMSAIKKAQEILNGKFD